MKFDSEMLIRVTNTLQSPDPARRIAHFLLAKGLFALPAPLRKALFFGTQHYCPICQSHVRGFLALHRSYHAWCPVCRSLQRHRLVWLFLQQRTDLFSPRPRRLLHIAPEPAFAKQFQNMPQLRYISADLHDPTATLRMDLTKIACASTSVDVLFCSHVLEHIPDDRAALAEMRRVLKPGGWAIVMVPIVGDETREGEIPSSPAERERLYGQLDHVREYGRDFVRRLIEAGFGVTQATAADLVSPSEVARLGLSVDDIIFYCTR